MAGTDEVALVMAAREGDERARDALVGAYLPLVYNVVGRALNGHADVDDVVQETLIRALDGLPSLREVERFRSWLVTIAVNEIRRHFARRAGVPHQPGHAPEVDHQVADPGADFVDLTLMQLELDGQRREAVAATRWLESDDRTVLSLWWLEAAGQLTRAEVAAALRLDPPHAAVVVQRVKAQLESARVVVRALEAAPRCAALTGLLTRWDGVPSALWRKRIVRHARECAPCSGHRGALLPAEGLLAGFALVTPVALSLRWGGGGAYAATSAGTGTSAGAGAGTEAGTSAARVAAAGGAGAGAGLATLGAGQGPRGAARLRRVRRRRRAVAAGAVAFVVLGGVIVGGGLLDRKSEDGPSATVADATTTPPVREDSPTPSSPTPTKSPTKSPKSSPSPSPSKTATKSPKPKPTRTTPSTPPPRPSTPPPAPTGGPVQQVIALVNSERSKAGCGPVSGNSTLHSAALKHSQDMASRDYFDHTNPDGDGPGERISAAGYQWSTYGENIAAGQKDAASVMDGWMNSSGHRANILNCAFKELGVGIHDAPGGIRWTQKFGTQR